MSLLQNDFYDDDINTESAVCRSEVQASARREQLPHSTTDMHRNDGSTKGLQNLDLVTVGVYETSQHKML